MVLISEYIYLFLALFFVIIILTYAGFQLAKQGKIRLLGGFFDLLLLGVPALYLKSFDVIQANLPEGSNFQNWLNFYYIILGITAPINFYYSVKSNSGNKFGIITSFAFKLLFLLFPIWIMMFGILFRKFM